MEQNQVDQNKNKQNKDKIVVIGMIAVSVFIGIVGMTVKGLNSSSSYRKNTNSSYSSGSNSSYSGGSSSSYSGGSSSSSSSKKSNTSSSYKSTNPADYDSKGNYKPVNTMTQKEIRNEIEEIFKDNFYDKIK